MFFAEAAICRLVIELQVGDFLSASIIALSFCFAWHSSRTLLARCSNSLWNRVYWVFTNTYTCWIILSLVLELMMKVHIKQRQTFLWSIQKRLLILETVFKFTKTDAYFKESKVFDTQSTENDKIILCFTLRCFWHFISVGVLLNYI